MAVTTAHDESQQQFVIKLDGEPVGFAHYRRSGDTWTFDHTEVQPQHAGQGLAGRLVQDALDEAVAAGGRVIAECSYVAAYLRKHSEYAAYVMDAADAADTPGTAGTADPAATTDTDADHD